MHLKVFLQDIGVIPARTVVTDESGQASSTSGPSMLGKRSRSQYEDMSLSISYYMVSD